MLFQGFQFGETATIILYIGIILSSTFFAFLSQKKVLVRTKNNSQKAIRERFRIQYFIISFIILAFFALFNDVGIDKQTYMDIFEDPFGYHANSNLEIGYCLLNYICGFFIPNGQVMVMLVSFVTILLIFLTIYHFKNKISIGYSVMAYVCVFYFQSFNLIRIYFAGAILFFGFRYLINRRYFIYCLFVLLATSMHTSAIFMAILLILVVTFNAMNFKKIKNLVFLYASVTMFFLLFLVLIPYIKTVSIFPRYEEYFQSIEYQSAGMAQFFYNFVPLGLYLFNRHRLKDKEFCNIALLSMGIRLFCSLLAYSIAVFGRILILLNIMQLIFIPYIMKELYYSVSNRLKECEKSSVLGWRSNATIDAYRISKIVVFLYYIVVVYFYFSGYLVSDGIEQFKFL